MAIKIDYEHLMRSNMKQSEQMLDEIEIRKEI